MIALLLYLTSFLFVCLFFKYYLSLLRLVKQNIISPSSRGWEVQDQFSSWWRISFWLSTTFLTCSQMVCMCAHTHTHTHTQKLTARDSVVFSSVQFSHSHVQLFATPWTAARQASLSITNSRSLFKLKSIQSVMPSNQLILFCSPPVFNLSQHQGLFQ